jgi:hypothetical protein
MLMFRKVVLRRYMRRGLCRISGNVHEHGGMAGINLPALSGNSIILVVPSLMPV